MAHREQSVPPSLDLPGLAVFSLIFTAVFLLHAWLLRLPYFWDEAGYYIPAARDLLRDGTLIPHSTLTNAHPPLVMAWLALWWKLSGFTTAVTRTAMLLVSAVALMAVYRLGRMLVTPGVAVGATLLTALYPVWFAQSSLAHLDMAAAAFTLWGLVFYLRRNWWAATAWFAVACLCKETAVAAPLALCAWEWVAPYVPAARDAGEDDAPTARWKPALLMLAAVPLAAWFAYHYARTGHIFGNPEFLRYNVEANVNPARIVLAGLQRLWQAFGYMNMYVLTVTAAVAMLYSPIGQRQAIRRSALAAFVVLLAAYVAMLAVLGGAVLARYMLPVIPLVILAALNTVRRRIAWWKWALALTAVAFIAAWFVNPYYRSAPEDSLNYADYVRLHKSAEDVLQQKYAHARILTAWPASDELTRPWLGYVSSPLQVVRLENFSLPQISLAAQARSEYDVALVFSTKLEPSSALLGNWRWWQHIQERFFDYHRDLTPETIAAMLGGRIAYRESRNGQWIAILTFDRIQSAALHPPAQP